jgi:hypothetical protein
MKHIRNKIIELLDEHGGTFSICEGCAICTEIQAFSKKLNRNSTEKFKHILAKGQDMTKSDLVFLIDNDVPVAVIRKAVGINHTDFSNMLINYGLTQRRNKKEEDKEMAKITLEEYQELSNQGKADKEIALDKGMNIQYLSQLKKKWNIRPTLSLTAELKPSETKPTQEDKTAEYEAIITELKAKLEDKDTRLIASRKANEELSKMYEAKQHVDAACEDVENELDSLREENARLVKQGHHDNYTISNQKYQLEKWAMEVEALEEENKALKYFARKYLA